MHILRLLCLHLGSFSQLSSFWAGDTYFENRHPKYQSKENRGVSLYFSIQQPHCFASRHADQLRWWIPLSAKQASKLSCFQTPTMASSTASEERAGAELNTSMLWWSDGHPSTDDPAHHFSSFYLGEEICF